MFSHVQGEVCLVFLFLVGWLGFFLFLFYSGGGLFVFLFVFNILEADLFTEVNLMKIFFPILYAGSLHK